MLQTTRRDAARGTGRLLIGLMGLLVLCPGRLLHGQSGSRLTDSGVVRATAKVDSVFIGRTVSSVTIDVGDFAASLLARIGVASFPDSSGFRVTSDSMLVRVQGRIMDFPIAKRQELGPLLFFIDSTAIFVAEISMPQSDLGIMRFRLERVLVNGLPIPELLLVPAIATYSASYTELSAGGREFRVGMPALGKSALGKDQIRLWIRSPVTAADSAKAKGGGLP